MWALAAPSPKGSRGRGLGWPLGEQDEGEVSLCPCQGQGGDGERDPGLDLLGLSGGGEMDHPELGEQGHAEEQQVVGEQADAIGLSQLEALRWHRHEGEHQAQPQRPGQHPHQRAVRLQLWGQQGMGVTLGSCCQPGLCPCVTTALPSPAAGCWSSAAGSPGPRPPGCLEHVQDGHTAQESEH